MNAVDDAREKINGITPGEWAWTKYDRTYEVWTRDTSIEPDGDVADNIQHLADAEFIAAAPDLVRGLLAELDQAREFIEDIATHGVHADLNPTRRWDGDQQSEYRWWGEYIGGADRALRTRALRILGGDS
ncbi:hypothetical protein SEA_BIRDSONG_61 [Gordonia phage Birdsong]|nr:hypothetical protein SEA_BEARBQ_59 [Gordonia phage BearBQ]